jgi:hypothetical protein
VENRIRMIAASAGQESEPRRKTYASPRLTQYGRVEKLTQSGGSTQPDAHQTMQVHPGGGNP